MVVITAGTEGGGTYRDGRPRETVGFEAMISSTVSTCERFGYEYRVFDLGGLGFGEQTFRSDELRLNGAYGGTRSSDEKRLHRGKGAFKPLIIEEALKDTSELVVYLDGDAVLRRPIQEIDDEDFDIAFTIRQPEELDWYMKAPEERASVGMINAGVIFVRPTATVFSWLKWWKASEQRLGSDQWAINEFLQKEMKLPTQCPAIGKTYKMAGLNIRFFPTLDYNFYYFTTHSITEKTRIVHFKGGKSRRLFPNVLESPGDVCSS